MIRLASVAIEKTTCHFDKLFGYIVPFGMDLSPGMRVYVPFGSSKRIGLVVSLEEADSVPEQFKNILCVLDDEPILDREGLFLLSWIRDEAFCTWFDALSVLIPAGFGLRGLTAWSLASGNALPDGLSSLENQILNYLHSQKKPRSASDIGDALGCTVKALPLEDLESMGLIVSEDVFLRKVQDKTERMIRPTGNIPEKLTAKQQDVYDFLLSTGGGSVAEIEYFTGVGKSVLDKLCKSGAAEYFNLEVLRVPTGSVPVGNEVIHPVLTPCQQKAADLLWNGYQEGGKTALLYGVTGSGKTSVYLHLAEQVLADGHAAIVLVPEISLTPQTINRFRKTFGSRVALIHSGLSISQRLDEFKRIRRGLVDVVVGTRSAVFAPLPNLGLIIVDEEQEHTYQSEMTPRYDAREVARVRMKYHKGLAVLASATPSMESMYRSQKGDFLYAEIPERYGNAKLPDVTILDLKAYPLATEALSEELCEEIGFNLARQEQTILLVNRRGYSAMAQCMSCHKTIQCPNCSISMKFHSANSRLMCHYCGYSMPPPSTCPTCGKPMIRFSGVGTQKVEEALKFRFPEARILRMDQDTTLRKDSHEKMLEAFGKGEYDILLGTQMVAKGLDFPRVTLTGVLTPDQSLYADDFRAFERTFSLITQVVGRSGRNQLPGRAILQTYQPDHPVIQCAARQDYKSFYKVEIHSRQSMLYPPFCRLYCVGLWSEVEADVLEAGKKVLSFLSSTFKDSYPDLPVRILGLSPASIYKVAGRYRVKILIKGKNSPRMREVLHSIYSQQELKFKTVSITIDSNFDASL